MRCEVFDLLIMVSIYSEVCHPHLLPSITGPGEPVKKVRQGDIERRISAAAVLAAINLKYSKGKVVTEDDPRYSLRAAEEGKEGECCGEKRVGNVLYQLFSEGDVKQLAR